MLFLLLVVVDVAAVVAVAVVAVVVAAVAVVAVVIVGWQCSVPECTAHWGRREGSDPGEQMR